MQCRHQPQEFQQCSLAQHSRWVFRASGREILCDTQLESHLFPETSIKTRSYLAASENLRSLRKHFNHFAQLTATACRKKIAVICHHAATKQESRVGRKGDSSRCRENFRLEERNYPNRNRSWAFIFGKGVQFLYPEAEIFPCCDSHNAFTTTPDSELLFFRPKKDPTIFSQFSTPELFQSTITSGSVWNQSLLSVVSLAEHECSQNRAYPAPKTLSIPQKALMETASGSPISSQPAKPQGPCGKYVTAVTAVIVSLSVWKPRGVASLTPGAWHNSHTYFHIYFATRRARF